MKVIIVQMCGLCPNHGIVEIKYDPAGNEVEVYYCKLMRKRIKNLNFIDKRCELMELKKDDKRQDNDKEKKDQLRFFEND